MGGAEGCFKGNTKEKWQRGSCPPELGAQVPTAAKGKPSGWVLTVWGPPHHTNGKKKLKGSLALMVGGARKPASAGADTSTNVTAAEMTTVLSGPGRGSGIEMSWAVTFTILAWGFSRDPYLVHFTSIPKATGSWQEPCKRKLD